MLLVKTVPEEEMNPRGKNNFRKRINSRGKNRVKRGGEFQREK